MIEMNINTMIHVFNIIADTPIQVDYRLRSSYFIWGHVSQDDLDGIWGFSRWDIFQSACRAKDNGENNPEWYEFTLRMLPKSGQSLPII